MWKMARRQVMVLEGGLHRFVNTVCSEGAQVRDVPGLLEGSQPTPEQWAGRKGLACLQGEIGSWKRDIMLSLIPLPAGIPICETSYDCSYT